MCLLAEQPYVKVHREINSLEQKDVELKRVIYLYEDKVVTQNREFSIQDVIDMSYRALGEDGGMLYMHTSKGVYSYIVKSSPMEFIDVFKKQIKKQI